MDTSHRPADAVAVGPQRRQDADQGRRARSGVDAGAATPDRRASSATSMPSTRNSTTSASRLRRQPRLPGSGIRAQVDASLGAPILVRPGRQRRNHVRRPDALSLAPGPGRRQHAREHGRPKSKGSSRTATGSHDARIVWENASKKLSLGLYGNNLFDKAYKTDGQEFSSVGNIRTVYYGAPRTFTLKFTARY